MATVWFADDERAIATTVGSLSIPLGCIMGMVTGPFFILDRDKVNHAQGKEHVNKYMFVSAVIITIMNVGVLLFFTERPKIYPSKAA